MEYVVTTEREITYFGAPKTIQDKFYFETEAEAREWAALPHPLYLNFKVVSIEPHRPRYWWIVTYDYTGSPYFDSPFHRVTEREAFDTYAEAVAWSKQPHPELLNYCTLGIHKEQEIIRKGFAWAAHPSSFEARQASDRCTDIAIINRR